MQTLRTKTFEKSFIETFCYSNKVTNKVTKRFPKLSNKEMYLTLLIKLERVLSTRTFKFTSWTNFPQEYHILSPYIWGKTFANS